MRVNGRLDRPANSISTFSLRAFAVIAAFFALAMTPFFLASMGRNLQHPISINVRRQALPDGSVAIRASEAPNGRPLTIRVMRIDDGPELKPGSLHVMLMKLNRDLKAGDTFNLTLKYEKAGEVPVQVKVQPAN